MSFLDTLPAPIHRLEPGGPWAQFRVADPRACELELRAMVREDLPLSVGVAGGPVVPASLWSADAAAGQLHLSLTRPEDDAPTMQHLLGRTRENHELWAAGYRGDLKLQFDLPEAMLQRQGHDSRRWVVRCAWPRLLLRLPRRGAVRVRRGGGDAPAAIFHHPLARDHRVRLRVLDISESGCALWNPRDGIPLPPGVEIRKVEVELDDEAIFFTDLRIQNAVAGPAGAAASPPEEAAAGPRPVAGVKLGCSWVDLPPMAAETLHRWIRQGRRRRDLISLSFD